MPVAAVVAAVVMETVAAAVVAAAGEVVGQANQGIVMAVKEEVAVVMKAAARVGSGTLTGWAALNRSAFEVYHQMAATDEGGAACDHAVERRVLLDPKPKGSLRPLPTVGAPLWQTTAVVPMYSWLL